MELEYQTGRDGRVCWKEEVEERSSEKIGLKRKLTESDSVKGKREAYVILPPTMVVIEEEDSAATLQVICRWL